MPEEQRHARQHGSTQRLHVAWDEVFGGADGAYVLVIESKADAGGPTKYIGFSSKNIIGMSQDQALYMA